MKRVILVYMLIACFSYGCRQEKVEVFKDFPTVSNLNAYIIKTPPVFNGVMELVMLDDVLIAFDGMSDKFFHVFGSANLNYIGSYFSQGRGPFEETFIDPYFRRTNKNTIIYRTDSKVKTFRYDAVAKEFELINETEIPEEILEMQQVFFIDDTFYCWDYFSESKVEFIGFREGSGSVFSFGTFVPEYKELQGIEYNQALFARILTVKPDQKQFAVVYDKFPILRIYETRKGRLLKEVRYENNQTFPMALIDKNPSRNDFDLVMQNYRKIKSTNTYIYALYIGKSTGEIKQRSKVLGDFSNEIHVWNWAGEPVKRILLDRDIFSFEVSPDDNALIASSINSSDELYHYTLSWD